MAVASGEGSTYDLTLLVPAWSVERGTGEWWSVAREQWPVVSGQWPVNATRGKWRKKAPKQSQIARVLVVGRSLLKDEPRRNRAGKQSQFSAGGAGRGATLAERRRGAEKTAQSRLFPTARPSSKSDASQRRTGTLGGASWQALRTLPAHAPPLRGPGPARLLLEQAGPPCSFPAWPPGPRRGGRLSALSAQPLSTGGCGRVCLGFWALDL